MELFEQMFVLINFTLHWSSGGAASVCVCELMQYFRKIQQYVQPQGAGGEKRD